jgi:flavin reductase (DIM6/NTAB) family NADH-FMN oxidoreductase RutF
VGKAYKSIVVPRPIGWISTANHDGIVNLAPYSHNLAYDPPYVMFAANSFPQSGHRKDSAKNAADTGEFVVNMATYDLRAAVNITSQFVAPDVDEAKLAGLEMIPSRLVQPPRVAASPVHLECKFHCAVALPARVLDQVHHIVIGRVIGVHIRDDALTADGKLDVLKIRPLARLGYHDYTSVESSFTCGRTDRTAKRAKRGSRAARSRGKRSGERLAVRLAHISCDLAELFPLSLIAHAANDRTAKARRRGAQSLRDRRLRKFLSVRQPCHSGRARRKRGAPARRLAQWAIGPMQMQIMAGTGRLAVALRPRRQSF